MNGAEVLLRTLLSSGIDTCFMNPGTSEMQFVAALDRVPGMRGVLCLFEGVCSGAADGYARMLGKPASTLLHLGPGLANGLANFHNARKARSPVVSIVGEHSTKHSQYDAPLSADIETFARSVSKDVLTPAAASELGEAASATVRAARRPPGQIAHLIVPADFSWSEAGQPGEAPVLDTRSAASDVTVRRLADLLRHGPGTAFLLGGSALTGGALDSARPVSFFGYPDQPSYLAPESAKVYTLAAIDEDGGASLAALAQLVRADPAVVASARPDAMPAASHALTPATVGCIVANLLPEGAIVCDEAISSAEPIGSQLLHAAPHDILPVTGGSIGQGLPVAVGAAIACPDRKVVALEADGSAMYTLQALWTMARERLDVVTVILNNRRYQILDVEMKRTGANGFGPVAENMIDIGRPDINFVKLSEAMGVEATRVHNCGEFADHFAAAMRADGPRLIEVML